MRLEVAPKPGLDALPLRLPSLTASSRLPCAGALYANDPRRLVPLWCGLYLPGSPSESPDAPASGLDPVGESREGDPLFFEGEDLGMLPSATERGASGALLAMVGKLSQQVCTGERVTRVTNDGFWLCLLLACYSDEEV